MRFPVENPLPGVVGDSNELDDVDEGKTSD
jgi:hypothetical protein